MIPIENLKALGFNHTDSDWYEYNSRYIDLSLCNSATPYLFLGTKNSGYREEAPFVDLTVGKLNKIIKFINDYESN